WTQRNFGMRINIDDKRLTPSERKLLIQIGARLARSNATATATEIYQVERKLPEAHFRVDRGDLGGGLMQPSAPMTHAGGLPAVLAEEEGPPMRRLFPAV